MKSYTTQFRLEPNHLTKQHKDGKAAVSDEVRKPIWPPACDQSNHLRRSKAQFVSVYFVDCFAENCQADLLINLL